MAIWSMLRCPGCGAQHPGETYRTQCCNPDCLGAWGTGCYHCHHPHYGKPPKRPVLTRASLRLLARLPSMPSDGMLVTGSGILAAASLVRERLAKEVSTRRYARTRRGDALIGPSSWDYE